ncbi:hypothetical protein [Kamptonema sp. UHCC 0994]|uniref:hypothetical protein n=1 Tax=Kamptonema sp. UHCC 0994 TaxID=3031329 RepID=UPI0023B91E1E|nr:hypothetical protein [Kamptonema sp. UHCC 0994]MDF0553321.1 hypothetical protein [Kamptonema sp. UHCC 0994]
MLVPILIIDVALVAWSLHLMQEAIAHREFSLMLAGTLVAISAAGLVVVYFLMGSCLVHLTQMSNHSYSYF